MRRNAILAAWALPAAALAQTMPSERAQPAYVEQAPAADGSGDASPVYWPEETARPRGNAAQAEQVAPAGAAPPLAQVTRESGTRPVNQLSTGTGTDPLSQLTETERQVLIEAVEGSDLCARQDQIPAIRRLCAARLETRSADFGAPAPRSLSPEERLLGEGLGGDRVRTLERAIERLGRSALSTREFEDQAVASMALAQSTPEERPAAPGDGAGELSAETRALIEAIVNQVPGGGGTP